MTKKRLTLHEYINGIRAGERFILSRAITLMESTLEADQILAEELLEALLPFSGNSVRIGITGVPGVGKSTFINAIGPYLIKQGHKLAVLSIDPSSEISRGSILGDKTRMPELAQSPQAFIRPSATGSTLGGVAQKTRESMLLCEASGFDVIFIETVGVGQSETLVHQMVDCFLLLMLAGAGDELQGIKRGIMEMTDILVITKADGLYKAPAQQAKKEFQNALHLFPQAESQVNPEVLCCSALEPEGIEEVWQAIQYYYQQTQSNGYFQQRRQKQRLHWLHDTLGQQLKHLFYTHPAIQQELSWREKEVLEGTASPGKVARALMQKFIASSAQSN
ncbi:methylmalonyl Co-A mutase-associated GTPase MeaB [Catalinimonas niigatensis]|uniref:methylmalonyl Co-A mutase-associated GTPase MeaB n=1 Tax=Catalinimonas niigatensis TaxID=1397264 RepID=UPI0026665F85|nr:methylmalonyl Co-A mutase-associated GTPase MeaB [Catalinimonas niigatensis]WPP52604.1 methylmalonyl Co-A mutase-associated GTPase MeaB [Catalinimonas niigatensis]